MIPMSRADQPPRCLRPTEGFHRRDISVAYFPGASCLESMVFSSRVSKRLDPFTNKHAGGHNRGTRQANHAVWSASVANTNGMLAEQGRLVWKHAYSAKYPGPRDQVTSTTRTQTSAVDGLISVIKREPRECNPPALLFDA